MKITAISDLHGQLPDIEELPDADVLVIAGDICPDHFPFSRDRGASYQTFWLETEFRHWLIQATCKFENVIGIGGNHDFALEQTIPDGLSWDYLQDSGIEIGTYKFWGTPWVPNLPRWAFGGSSEVLELHAAAIPADTDVLVSHGPPKGYLDEVDGYLHVGSQPLADVLHQGSIPVVICGHIHEQHGEVDVVEGACTLYNVSLLNDNYQRVYKPTVITL